MPKTRKRSNAFTTSDSYQPQKGKNFYFTMSVSTPENAEAFLTELTEAACFCGIEPFTRRAPPLTLPCKHLVHEKCIRSWVNSDIPIADRCPTCRMKLFGGGRAGSAQARQNREATVADSRMDSFNPFESPNLGHGRTRAAHSIRNNQRYRNPAPVVIVENETEQGFSREDRHRYLDFQWSTDAPSQPNNSIFGRGTSSPNKATGAQGSGRGREPENRGGSFLDFLFATPRRAT